MGGLNVEINELKGTSLDLHTPPVTESDLIKGGSVCYNSVSVVEGTEDVEFHIPPDPECFFILSHSRLEGHFVVLDDNGGVVTSSDFVTLENHYAACIFSQIEIYLNGTQICDLSAPVSYPYKHYIDSTLSYDFNTLNNVGKSEGYFLNYRGYCAFSMENGAVSYTSCKDKKDAHEIILDGKKVYFNSTIPADLFLSDKYLPSNVEITIKLSRFNPKFGIIQREDNKSFNIILKDLKLHMWKVLPSERFRHRFQTKLNREPCFLPYKDTQLRQYHIPIGSSCFSIGHINNHILPNQIIFVFVRSEVLTKNKSGRWPFLFPPCFLTSAILKKNGKPLVPKPIECDFEKGDYVELFEHFNNNIGSRNRITLRSFKKKDIFLAFDLTPDKCKSFHNHPSPSGNLELDLTFSSPFRTPTTLISYAIYNSGIIIDKNFQVTKIKY